MAGMYATDIPRVVEGNRFNNAVANRNEREQFRSKLLLEKLDSIDRYQATTGRPWQPPQPEANRYYGDKDNAQRMLKGDDPITEAGWCMRHRAGVVEDDHTRNRAVILEEDELVNIHQELDSDGLDEINAGEVYAQKVKTQADLIFEKKRAALALDAAQTIICDPLGPEFGQDRMNELITANVEMLRETMHDNRGEFNRPTKVHHHMEKGACLYAFGPNSDENQNV